jgi:hypothetical protein
MQGSNELPLAPAVLSREQIDDTVDLVERLATIPKSGVVKRHGLSSSSAPGKRDASRPTMS